MNSCKDCKYVISELDMKFGTYTYTGCNRYESAKVSEHTDCPSFKDNRQPYEGLGVSDTRIIAGSQCGRTK